jgi:acetate CoA/acetoacetate CoA-transferase beta subunit
MAHLLLTDIAGRPVTALPGGQHHRRRAFGLIRGGHVDVCCAGLQDHAGRLANRMIPDRMVLGMGGAMDLVAGAPHVIVAHEATRPNRHLVR